MTPLDFISSQHELYQRYMAKVSGKFDLTSMELAIILFLANNPEYDTAKDIVERRHLTKSHVSISIRSLEEKEYLKKEFRNGNHRTSHLVLLPASKKAVKEGQKAQRDFMAVMARGFSESELDRIKKEINRVYDNIILELNEMDRGKK